MPVICIHIPKTAGTTLRYVMSHQYRGSRLYEAYTDKSFQDFLRMPHEQRNNIGMLIAHRAYGLHSNFTSECRYVTIMRDPVARVVSLYKFVKANRDHYLHDLVVGKKMDLAAYVSSGITVETDNCQTRMVAGGEEPPFGKCQSNMLERALKNLDDHFAVTGTMERFDETMCLFWQVMGWRMPLYMTMNAAKNSKSESHSISPETRALIEEHNKLDMALYTHVSKRMEQAINEKGSVFDKELQQYRRLNRIYGFIFGTIWKAKMMVLQKIT